MDIVFVLKKEGLLLVERQSTMRSRLASVYCMVKQRVFLII